MLALVITIGQAIVYVVTGMYGDVGVFNGALIVAQVSPMRGAAWAGSKGVGCGVCGVGVGVGGWAQAVWVGGRRLCGWAGRQGR